jgi:1,4-alpha-glucan branching enzyme
MFVFNWGSESIPDYEINVKNTGDYEIIFSSDDKVFGGFENIDKKVVFPSEDRDGQVFMKIYNVSRTAVVYKLKTEN